MSEVYSRIGVDLCEGIRFLNANFCAPDRCVATGTKDLGSCLESQKQVQMLN